MSGRLIMAVSVGLVLLVATAARGQADDRKNTEGPRGNPHSSAQAGRAGADLRERPGNGGPQSRRANRRRSVKLTAEQETELLAVLKDKRPDLHERLVRVRKENERSYRRSLRMAWRWYQRWKNMSPDEQAAVTDLENARLQIGRILQTVRRAKKPPTAEQRSELLSAVAQAFKAEGELQAIHIEQLEKEIQRIKEELSDRNKRRKDLIAERVEGLVRAITQPARRPGPPERMGPTTLPKR